MFLQLLNHATERGVLLSIFSSTGGVSWISHQNWNTTKHICEWEGVMCNRNGNVTELNLSSHGLLGKLPEDISSLLWLRSLDISNNSLTSQIPKTVCQMLQLKNFLAQGSGLYGTIPVCFCNM